MPRQPLVLSGSRSSGRQLGRRKLAELPHHLLALKDWDRLEQLVTTLPFVEAKFEAGQGIIHLSMICYGLGHSCKHKVMNEVV